MASCSERIMIEKERQQKKIYFKKLAEYFKKNKLEESY